MEERIIARLQQESNPPTLLVPSFSKPVWVDPQMNCDQCKFNDQDVDTFPCAKCHTRD